MKEQKVGFFLCDCHNRDHLIIAEHWVYEWSEKTMENEISLSFVLFHCYLGWRYNKKITSFFAEKWWRIKEALKILLFGSLRIEDSWLPLCNEVHTYNSINPDGANGEEELVRFANWIFDAVAKSKENIEEHRKLNK
uniref:Uncharacterized protein n=1 Tax=viral metagenome TaxID=1070528 RepID=A0A6H1ZB70_9ZZZZ